MNRALIVTLWVLMVAGLAACGDDAVEQAQVVSVTPTSVPTTAPLAVPTPTPVVTPAPAAPPQVAPTPLPTLPPTPTVAPATEPTPTVAPAATPTPSSTPTLDAAPSPTATSEAAPTTADGTPATGTEIVTETSTVVPTPAVEEPEETPTAVAAVSGEAPLECFDRDVKVYRALVEGVDELSFEDGRVYCSGAGTNAVSAALSYRHSSGLVVQRNADYISNGDGSAYIPYSGTLHFCMNAQPASAPVRADTVPALLIVIDNEAQRQLAQGASGPASFTGASTQC